MLIETFSVIFKHRAWCGSTLSIYDLISGWLVKALQDCCVQKSYWKNLGRKGGMMHIRSMHFLSFHLFGQFWKMALSLRSRLCNNKPCCLSIEILESMQSKAAASVAFLWSIKILLAFWNSRRRTKKSVAAAGQCSLEDATVSDFCIASREIWRAKKQGSSEDIERVQGCRQFGRCKETRE